MTYELTAKQIEELESYRKGLAYLGVWLEEAEIFFKSLPDGFLEGLEQIESSDKGDRQK